MRVVQPGVHFKAGDRSTASALAALPFLSGADPEALAELAPSIGWVSVSRSELVLDFQDDTNEVFIVVEGLVRVVVRTPLGQEVILDDLGPGEIFGEMAAIDHSPRCASISALHPTRLCRIPGPKFVDFVLRSPAVSLRLLQALTARLRLQDVRLTELALLPVRHRLMSELLRLSRPRLNGDGRIISPPIAHNTLAARIGARRETVTLALSELSRGGLLEATSRAIVLPHPEALRTMVNEQLQSGLEPVRKATRPSPGRVQPKQAVSLVS